MHLKKHLILTTALTGGGPSKTTQTIAVNIYDDAFGTFNMRWLCEIGDPVFDHSSNFLDSA